MSETVLKRKVLVADDERVIADTLVIILNQAGFDATAAYSGRTAVELAESLRPDMLISDVIMPDLSGIDAAISVLVQDPFVLRPGRNRRPAGQSEIAGSRI
jgi:CheY-like chemotaxis protein